MTKAEDGGRRRASPRRSEPESPDPVDVHVGLRLRWRRQELRMSQESLAAALGVSFQQIQKYERAANRISASKLWEVARALRVPTGYFFWGLTDAPGVGAASPSSASEPCSAGEKEELAAGLRRIKDPAIQRKLSEIVVELAGTGRV